MFSTESLDVRDVRQFDGGAVVVPDDQRPVIVGLEELIVGQNVRRLAAIPDLAFRHIRILLAQHIADILKAKPIAV